MIVDNVSPGQLGRSISLNRFIGDLGMMLGPVALGWVLDVSGFTLVALVTATMLVGTLPGIVLTVHEKPRAQWSPQR